MKFREDRPLAGVDAAVKKLLEIANGLEPDHAGRIDAGAINALFMSAGGDPPEYSAAVKAAIERGYMTMHPSGGYLSSPKPARTCSPDLGRLREPRLILAPRRF
jgi:hypothetical protein